MNFVSGHLSDVRCIYFWNQPISPISGTFLLKVKKSQKLAIKNMAFIILL